MRTALALGLVALAAIVVVRRRDRVPRQVSVLRVADPARVDALRVLRLRHRTGRAVAAATLSGVATEVAAGWADLLDGEEIAYSGVEPAREARTEPLPDDLDPRVASALVANGVTALYRHQAEAWEAAQRGENVVVTTGTASGKSLAFNLPVLDAIAREPKTRALYLYPTKALAQDQARALAGLQAEGAQARDLRRRHAGASGAGRSASGRT